MRCYVSSLGRLIVWTRWPKWLERGFTDRKVRGSNPTCASRRPLSMRGQPDSIPALVLPSGGMTARHRKGATAERAADGLRRDSALEIYRGPDRVWWLRSFGIFCLGQATVWSGLTYYREWYDKAKHATMKRQLADLVITAKGTLSQQPEDDRPLDSVELTPAPETTSDGGHEPSSKTAQWLASFAPKLAEFSSKTKKFDAAVVPILTVVIAGMSFGLGLLLPRRIVRRITLLGTGSGTSKFQRAEAVEIHTYGAFGLRREGVRFRVPLSYVSAQKSRSQDSPLLGFSWLERKFTDRRIRGSSPISAFRLPLSTIGQPGSIPALVVPKVGMTASANLLTGRSVFRTLSLPLDFPCLGLDNLAVSQPSCFLRVAWQVIDEIMISTLGPQNPDVQIVPDEDLVENVDLIVFNFEDEEGAQTLLNLQQCALYLQSVTSAIRIFSVNLFLQFKEVVMVAENFLYPGTCISYYGKPGSSQKAPAVRSRIRSETVMLYYLSPRARPAPYSQDPTSVVLLRPLRARQTFHISLFGHPVILMRRLAELHPSVTVDWIPENSRLCAVRLSGSIKINAGRCGKWCLFVVSAYAPTDSSSQTEKDTFYQDLSRLFWSARRTNIVVLTGDMNA
ncbi:hypothetical protein T265_09742 [Opisthorchis viverrini]|uniref:Uncharacterized protein n=1 Tax=Opisthorchis viverrini TaxID=6198 RepID=A0A074ZFS6_OPIVI|nr:hypothetical protein T265_09742 [Opisthorchis viverrini]KER22090.1 hypothetical protein T265_09742 [Opisthorchis viverrini]